MEVSIWRFNSSMFLGNFVLNKSLKIGRLFDLITEYVDSGSLLMMESAGESHHLAQWEVMIDIFIWWQPSGGQKWLLRRFTPKLWRKWKIADLINVSLNPDQTQLIQMYGLSMFNLLFIPSLPYISSSPPHFYGTSQSSSATPKKLFAERQSAQ